MFRAASFEPAASLAAIQEDWGSLVRPRWAGLPVRWPQKRPAGYSWFWIGTHAEYDRLLRQT